ncbi:MAG: hypothetical protein ACK4OM_06995 [Alphaproteobacteria bacterium]
MKKKNKISSNELEFLFQNIDKLNNLTLDNYHITKNVALQIANSLKDNNSIKSINIVNCYLKDITAFIEVLTIKSKIISISFENTTGISQGWYRFREILETRHYIEELNISNCNIKSRRLEQIIRSIKLNHSMVKLNISGNKVKDNIYPLLLQSLLYNETLMVLNLKKIPINEKFEHDLINVLETNKILAEIYFDNSHILSETLKNKLFSSKQMLQTLLQMLLNTYRNHNNNTVNMQSLVNIEKRKQALKFLFKQAVTNYYGDKVYKKSAFNETLKKLYEKLYIL